MDRAEEARKAQQLRGCGILMVMVKVIQEMVGEAAR